MNKRIMFSLFAAVVLFGSCNKSSTKVTVIRKSTNALAATSNYVMGDYIYDVVTPSNDTVMATMHEKIGLSNALPFKATMEKTEGERYGTIVQLAK
jgi:hypothetical protein